jgi:hypothetical protein
MSFDKFPQDLKERNERERERETERETSFSLWIVLIYFPLDFPWTISLRVLHSLNTFLNTFP